jgi:LPS-assembly lipoprotein
MSLCKAYWRVFAAVFVLALAAPLAGCIQPLYGPNLDGTSNAAELRAVEVDEIPERIGHYVRNELIYGFNGTGAQVTPRYRLKVKLSERVQTPIYNTTTSFSTSATVVVDANYSLMTLPDNVEIAKGVAQALASYDRFTARFTNIRAARDAEIRDAKVIADSIRTRIAIDMATRH